MVQGNAADVTVNATVNVTVNVTITVNVTVGRAGVILGEGSDRGKNNPGQGLATSTLLEFAPRQQTVPPVQRRRGPPGGPSRFGSRKNPRGAISFRRQQSRIMPTTQVAAVKLITRSAVAG